jgi:hypothetical protein
MSLHIFNNDCIDIRVNNEENNTIVVFNEDTTLRDEINELINVYDKCYIILFLVYYNNYKIFKFRYSKFFNCCRQDHPYHS